MTGLKNTQDKTNLTAVCFTPKAHTQNIVA